MKICFLLQRRWVRIGHSMIRHLKEDFPDTEFCAFVTMRESYDFLHKQKDIAYTSLLLEQDLFKRIATAEIDYEYIRSIEKEYGLPNLWPYLYVDRTIMNGQLIREYPHDEPLLSREDMIKYVQVSAKAIIEFLDKEKPEVLVMSIVGSVGGSLLYHIAKKRGIKTITIHHACIDNRIALTEYYKNFSWVKQRFDEIQAGRVSPEKDNAKKYVEDFRAKPKTYLPISDPSFNDQTSKLSHLRFLKLGNLARGIPWYFSTLLHDLKKIGNSDFSDIFIWWVVWDKFKRKLRGVIGYDDLYSPFDPNERFAYYPLHFDPEVATMLFAPYYTDQIRLVKAIARSLPLDMVLYVKDHAPMLGYRTRSYYKEILKCPNIKLINPSTRGLDILQKTELTFTITGTSGWESILLKKPVINFGHFFYNDVPGVRYCNGYEELPYLVRTQLEEWKHDEPSVINFVSAMLEDTVPSDYAQVWDSLDDAEAVARNEGIRVLSRLLEEKIGLK